MTIYVYSTLTGNTEKLARAVHDRLHPDSPIYDIRKLPEGIEQEDAVFLLFYWNARGTADPASLTFYETLKGKKVIAMGTLGAYADGPHGQRMKERVRALLEAGGNEVLADFCCRGKIEVTRTIRRMQIPEGDSHYMDRDAILRHLTSHLHPNKQDFEAAIEAASHGLAAL